MKDPKTISLLLIPYLTVCAALYHISYWQSFNVNGLAFISISDIIKSSVYPMFSTLAIVVFNLIVQHFAFAIQRNSYAKSVLRTKMSNPLVILFIFLGIQIALIATLYYAPLMKIPHNWLWIGYIYAFIPSILLANSSFLENQFNSDILRSFIIYILVFSPIFSFAIGKYQSLKIRQNIEYKFTVRKNIASSTTISADTIKFIGYTDKHFVFSDLNNSEIIFIRSDIVDTLILYDKK